MDDLSNEILDRRHQRLSSLVASRFAVVARLSAAPCARHICSDVWKLFLLFAQTDSEYKNLISNNRLLRYYLTPLFTP